MAQSLCSALVKYKPKCPVSLGVAVVKILEWVSGHVGVGVGGGLGETNCDTKDYTPLLFPFKVDQFKSDIKIRNNQVKKNTAKGYSIYIHGISLQKSKKKNLK